MMCNLMNNKDVNTRIHPYKMLSNSRKLTETKDHYNKRRNLTKMLKNLSKSGLISKETHDHIKILDTNNFHY